MHEITDQYRGWPEQQEGEGPGRRAHGSAGHVHQPGGGHRGHGHSHGQTHEHHPHTGAHPLRGSDPDHQCPVVRIVRAFPQSSEHPGGHEGRDAAGQAAQHRAHPGPHGADHQHGPSAVTVAKVTGRELREHVTGEEHGADQPSHGVRLLHPGHHRHIIGDHPRDDRSVMVRSR